MPNNNKGKCECELCEGKYLQVDPVGCGCTECITGEYRPARDEYDYDVHQKFKSTPSQDGIGEKKHCDKGTMYDSQCWDCWKANEVAPVVSEWEMAFDEAWPQMLGQVWKEMKSIEDIAVDERPYLKAFIRKLLSSRNKQIAEVIRSMKADERKVMDFGDYEAETYDEKTLANAVLEYVADRIESL